MTVQGCTVNGVADLTNFARKRFDFMLARDKYHDAVRSALESDGWKITHDPYYLEFEGVTYNIDLGAEQVLGAEKEGQTIAVEIKSFLGDAWTTNVYLALGQFFSYRVGLKKEDVDRILYLAMPVTAWDRVCKIPIVQETFQEMRLKLIIYNPIDETIVKWIE